MKDAWKLFVLWKKHLLRWTSIFLLHPCTQQLVVWSSTCQSSNPLLCIFSLSMWLHWWYGMNLVGGNFIPNYSSLQLLISPITHHHLPPLSKFKRITLFRSHQQSQPKIQTYSWPKFSKCYSPVDVGGDWGNDGWERWSRLVRVERIRSIAEYKRV